MLEINDIKELHEDNFPINLKVIQKYQRSEPSIIAKYKNGAYRKCFFLVDSNTDLKLLICKDKIVIISEIQSYVLNCYHTYLLHPIMNRTEENIYQILYWPDIIDTV